MLPAGYEGTAACTARERVSGSILNSLTASFLIKTWISCSSVPVILTCFMVETFSTLSFRLLAKETKEGLLIKPLIDDQEEVIEYRNKKETGLIFPKGINPQVLIDKIKEIDG